MLTFLSKYSSMIINNKKGKYLNFQMPNTTGLFKMSQRDILQRQMSGNGTKNISRLRVQHTSTSLEVWMFHHMPHRTKNGHAKQIGIFT